MTRNHARHALPTRVFRGPVATLGLLGSFAAALMSLSSLPAGADATYQPLPVSQNWTNTALITTSDSWSGVPGFMGYRGDGLTITPGIDPQTVLGDDLPGVLDVNANQSNPVVFNTGGVAEFELADPVVALTGSTTAAAPYLVLYVNASGKGNLQVSYKLRDLEGVGGTDNAVQPVALHFRTSGSGPWTNVPLAFVADATDGPALTKDTVVSTTLPAGANNAATLQLRWMTTNAAGTDEWVGIDSIVVAATQTFVDATTGPLGDAAADGVGVAWGNFDGDADLDLFVVNNGQPDRLFRNDGASWTDATSGVLIDNTFGYAVATADYDNDGDLDLMLNNGGPLRLARNDAGTWVNAATGALNRTGGGRGLVWGDFDNDGDVDLFMSNDNDSCRLMRNDAGTWVNATNGLFGGIGAWQGAAAGDFDSDGDLDLYVVNASGSSNRLYRNDGGMWTNITSAPLNGPSNSRGVAWGDYDNDGDLDLYVSSFGNANKLYRNDGGVWVDATSGPLGDTGAGTGVAWADYDNDGDLDLYLVNQGTANKLFRNDAGTWVDATSGPLGDTGQGRGAAWGDYDNDGDLDLFVTNSGGSNRLLRNDNGLGNRWLHVNLVGTASNRSGIGARVRVVAGGVAHIVEISGGSGYCSQNSLTAEFGLGGASLVDSVIVRWPSGALQVVSPVPSVNTVTTVVEVVPPFVDATVGPLGGAGTGPGVAWGDYDNDGDLDLYLSNGNVGDNELFRHDGANWVDATTPPVNAPGASLSSVWGDYDNDGDLDLFVPDALGGPNKLFRNDAGTWADASTPALGSGGYCAAWVDFDLEGDIDVYLTCISHANMLLRNDAGSWVDVATGPLLGTGNSRTFAWGDFDNDGDPDLFLANGAQANQLIRNDLGTWTQLSESIATMNNARGASWGDFDNDGLLDLLVTRSGFSNIVYRNTLGSWTATVLGPNPGTGTHTAAVWGDYDNDGDLDIFQTGYNGSTNQLFRNDGGVWTAVAADPLVAMGLPVGAAWGDYDRDGDLDLFVTDQGTLQANHLFRNTLSSSNHWLHVKLEGVRSNRSAIGARVRLRAGGVNRIQEVSGGSAYCSQNSLEVEFGLGATATIDSLIINWPSGIVQVVSPVPAVDQLITVVEAVPPFSDITSGPLGDPGESEGVAWGDYDNDGDLDLFLANFDSPSHLFRNDGGTWVDATSGPLAIEAYANAAVWGDYDNDGDLDLYVTRGGVFDFEGLANSLFRNDAGTWVEVANGAAADPGVGRGAAWADYDNDGDLDLTFGNRFTDNVLARNDGGLWSDATTVPLGANGRTDGVAWGDYDNDGDLDLVQASLFSGTRPNRLLRNDAGTWVSVTPLAFANTGNSAGVAWGDYDNDGDLDLYVASFSGAGSGLFRNDAGTWVDATAGALIGGADLYCPAWGDYDNDGDLDLFVAGYSGNRLYRNDGGTWSDATIGAIAGLGGGQNAAFGDYDGDGDLDLYVSSFTAPNQLFRNDNPGTNHWFQAKLVGTVSNRSAIGARVRVVAGGLSHIEEVSGGSGYLAQNSLDVEFGLGANTLIDSLIVHWPSGIVWDTTGVNTNQRLTLVERPSLLSADAGAALPTRLELSQALPNPFQRSTRIAYALPKAGTVRLTVHDLQGRVVATLAEGNFPAGRHTAIWDGSGSGAGVYFVRLTQDGQEIRVRKLVLTR